MPIQKEQQKVKKVHFTDHHIASKVKGAKRGMKGKVEKVEKELKSVEPCRVQRKIQIHHQKALPLTISEEPTLPTADFVKVTKAAVGSLGSYVHGWNLLLNSPIRLVKIGTFTFAVAGRMFLAERSIPFVHPQGSEEVELESGTRLIKEGAHLYAGSRLFSKMSLSPNNLRAPVSEQRSFRYFQRLKPTLSGEVLHVIATQSWENILRHKKIVFFGLADLSAVFPTSRIRPYSEKSASYDISSLRRVGSEAYLARLSTRIFSELWVQYLDACIEAGRVRHLRQKVESDVAEIADVMGLDRNLVVRQLLETPNDGLEHDSDSDSDASGSDASSSDSSASDASGSDSSSSDNEI